MNFKEKVLLISNNLFGSFLNSLYFIYPSYFNFPSSVYFSLVAISYIASILGSIIFGNLKINDKNYITISLIGVIGPLVSTLLLLVPNQIIFTSSYFLFNFTYYATYFAFLLYYKDVKLNFYFNIYWTIGSVLPQVTSLVLSIIYNLYLVAFLFLISIIIILVKNIYLFLFTEKYSLNLLEKIDKAFSIVENNIDNFNAFHTFYGGLIFPINVKRLKLGFLEIYNMIVLIGFSLVWSSFIYSINEFSLSFFYPLFLFINGLITSILYAIYKRDINFNIIRMGIILRFLIGIILFISIILFIKNFVFNFILIFILSILFAFSWTMFQYFFDNYIINKYPQKFGNVYFFRNLGGAIGSILLYLLPVSYGLIFSFLILGISIFFFNYVLKY